MWYISTARPKDAADLWKTPEKAHWAHRCAFYLLNFSHNIEADYQFHAIIILILPQYGSLFWGITLGAVLNTYESFSTETNQAITDYL